MICRTIGEQEGQVSYKDALVHYRHGREEIYIPNLETFISVRQLLDETYTNWEKDVERREMRDSAYDRPSIQISVSTDGEKTSTQNNLEEEKTIAEIDQIGAEIRKTNSETTAVNIRNAIMIAIAAVLITLAIFRPDLLPDIADIWDGLKGLFG